MKTNHTFFSRGELPVKFPLNIEEKAKDMSLENQLLPLISNQKWNIIVDIFLKIDIKKYAEMNDMMLKLIELITEENSDDFHTNEVIDKFMKEMVKKVGIKFLPIHRKILSQFAATLILHLKVCKLCSRIPKSLPGRGGIIFTI